jgi:hypothetical protein
LEEWRIDYVYKLSSQGKFELISQTKYKQVEYLYKDLAGKEKLIKAGKEEVEK